MLVALGLVLGMAVGAPVSALAAIGGNQMPLIDNRSIEGWPSDQAPSLNCVSAYALEANTGSVVFSKEGDRSMHPASITKVMTALVVIENCDNLDELVSIEKEDVDYLEVGGNNWSMNWKGEKLPVRDCLYALLLESVNECGMALARHIAGSVPAFCDLMNKKAISLGCTGTHFTNPHGLNDEEHVTTAHDMALIFRACLQNETFYEIDTTVKYKIQGTTLNPKGMTCYMHDRMMRSDSEYYNEYVKAGKTGYTSICGNTLLTYAEKGDQQLVICVLKGNSAANTYADTKNIMKYAFGNFTVLDATDTMERFAASLSTRGNYKLGVDGNAKLYVPNNLIDTVVMHYEPSDDYSDGEVGTSFFHSNGQILSIVRIMGLGPADPSEVPAPQTVVVTDETGAAEGDPAAAGTDETDVAEGNPASDSVAEDAASSAASENTQQPVSKSKGLPLWVKALISIVIVASAIVVFWLIGCYLSYKRREKERERRREERRRRMRESREK